MWYSKNSVSRILIFTIILTLIVPVALPIATVYTQASTAADDSSTVVRVGYFAMDGYYEGGEDEPKSGFGYEYLQKIASITGWKYEYVYGEFSDILDLMKEGKIDLIGDMSYTRERTAYMDYSSFSTGMEEYWLYCKSDSGVVNANDLSTLNGKKLGTVAQSVQTTLLEEWLADSGIGVQVVLYSGSEELLAAFDNHEVDAINMAGTNVMSTWIPIANVGTSETYFGVNPQKPDILRKLNEALSYIQINEPTFNQDLASKYKEVSESVLKTLSPTEIMWLKSHDTLTIGIINDFMPYSDSLGHDRYSGIIKDIVASLKNNLDVGKLNIKVRNYSDYPTLREAYVNGEIDAAFPVFSDFNIAEEHGDILSNEIVQMSGVFLSYGEATDEKLRLVATVADTPVYYYVLTNYPNSQIITYDDYTECMKALRRQKVNCVAVDGYMANTLIREDTGLVEYSFPKTIGLSFTFSRENIGALRLINRAASFLSEEEKAMLLNKYAFDTYTYTTYGFIRDHLSLVIALFALLVFALIGALVMFSFANKAGNKLKENEKTLAGALEEAKEASAAKSSFLSNMSHDLRTPMNAITGFTKMAQKHIDDKSKVSDCLDKIAISGEHMTKLINDVLDMSRIEEGLIELTIEPTDIVNQMEAVSTLCKENAQNKGVEFNFILGEMQNRLVYADILHVNQIVLNIISNAIKYTPGGGKVEYTLCQLPPVSDGCGLYRMEVKDTGVGMSPEFLKHVYDTFAREKSTTISGVEGTGLGMSIVKRLVDAMDGMIEIKSEINEGTKVTVDIPLKMQPVGKDNINDSKPVTDNFGENNVNLLAGLRVLLVEDNEMNREIACDMLQDQDMIVEEADDGDVAVSKVEEMIGRMESERFDFILMDIQMPRMDGYAATKEIRQLLADADMRIPIIALSANAFEEDKKKSLDAGMDAHLAKPIEIECLYDTLCQFIR